MGDLFNLNIENFPVGRGELTTLDYPSFYGLQEVKAPLFVYRASKQIAPCLVVTSCVHGDETNGLRISQSIMRSNLKLTKGTLIVLPAVNIYGFLNKQRYLPDRKDLNRSFPGSKSGSFGERFAGHLLAELSRYGDVFVDLHSGGPGRFNVPQIRCDLATKGIQELVDAISIPLVVNSSLRDGSLREAINDLGKPCIVFEGGEGLRIDETVTKYGVNLVRSILAHMGMIKTVKEFNESKVIIQKTRWIRARVGGLLISKTRRGMVVQKGEPIGVIKNLNGETLSKITMIEDGVILGINRSGMVMAGDALFNIGYLSDNHPKEGSEEFYDYFDFEM